MEPGLFPSHPTGVLRDPPRFLRAGTRGLRSLQAARSRLPRESPRCIPPPPSHFSTAPSGNWIAGRERSYSSPFAITEFDKTSALVDGKPVRIFAHLKGITPEAKTATDRNRDAALRTLAALSNWVPRVGRRGRADPQPDTGGPRGEVARAPQTGNQGPRRARRGRLPGLILAALLLLFLWGAYHPFGTDQPGTTFSIRR